MEKRSKEDRARFTLDLERNGVLHYQKPRMEKRSQAIHQKVGGEKEEDLCRLGIPGVDCHCVTKKATCAVNTRGTNSTSRIGFLKRKGER